MHALHELRWGDVPTWFAAVGTLGAVIAALALAIKASGRQQDDERALRQRAARQIVTVLRQGTTVGGQSLSDGPLVEISNGSGETITKVDVAVIITLPSGAQPLTWSWDGTHDGKPPYVLNRSSIYLHGHFTSHEASPRLPPDVPLDAITFRTTWQDGYGQFWERVDNGEPTTRGQTAASSEAQS